MDWTGPGPQTGARRGLRIKTDRTKTAQARCSSWTRSLSRFAGEGVTQTPQQTVLSRFSNVLSYLRLPMCPFFLAKRGFRRLDHLDVTLFPTQSPLQCNHVYCSSVPGNSSPHPQAAAGALQENCPERAPRCVCTSQRLQHGQGELVHRHPTKHDHGPLGSGAAALQ